MKIVILDETKKRKNAMAELLEEKGCDVVRCSASGEFMETIDSSTPDKIFIDVESWKNGRALYTYFKFGRKLCESPITFYNAPEIFNGIAERNPNQGDKVYKRYTDLAEVLGGL